MLKRITLLVLFIALSAEAFSQAFYSRSRNRSWSLTGGFGIGSYYGDLNNPGDIIDFMPDATFGVNYRLNNRLSAAFNVAWFMLRGDDAEATGGGREVRNLSFTSHNFEGALVAVINAYPVGNRFYQRPLVNPYTYFGVGLTYYNPRAEYQGEWYSLRPLQTEGNHYSAVTPIIPLGLGLKFRASPFINIILEGGYRFTFTDYLDDVSTVYQDPNSFTDPIARALADRRPEIGLDRWPAGHIRGNPEKNDGYFIGSIKVEYFITGELFGPDRYMRNIRKRR